MARYQERPKTVDAHIWWSNGDHPNDGRERFTEGEFKGELYEGKVVRYFRRPDVSGNLPCPECGRTFHVHGWIDYGSSGQTVCPGDFILTNGNGVYSAMHPSEFHTRYMKDRSIL